MPRVYSKERTYLPLPRPGLDVLVRNKSFVEYKEGKYYFNGKEVDKDELIQLLKEKLRADKQTVISYFVSGDSSYQEYVDVEGLIQNAIWDVKEEYIVKNFDKSVEYEELSKKDELFKKVNGKLYYVSYEIDSKGELKELRAFNEK